LARRTSGCYRRGEQGDQCPKGVALLRYVFLDRQLPPHGLDPAAQHHHRLALSVQERLDVLAIVFDDDLDLLADVPGVQLHPLHDRLVGRRLLDLGVIPVSPVVGQPEGQLVGRVVLQHVEDEAFLDGLPH